MGWGAENMRTARVGGFWAVVFLLGCAHARPRDASSQPLPEPGPPAQTDGLSRQSLAEGPQVRIEGERYIDPQLGFEISRPAGNWFFAPGQPVAEGIAVPVIVAQPESGAQVVVQVAPAVATATQFAIRLTSGLKSRPGFSTGSPAPLEGTDDGVGFSFTMGDAVTGRVAIVPGAGRMFVLLATWPTRCAPSVVSGVDRIVRSLRTEAAQAKRGS